MISIHMWIIQLKDRNPNKLISTDTTAIDSIEQTLSTKLYTIGIIDACICSLNTAKKAQSFAYIVTVVQSC